MIQKGEHTVDNSREPFFKLPYDVRQHSIRVGKAILIMSEYCDELKNSFGGSKKELDAAITDAAKYHDIGKLLLSDEILCSTGPLSETDWTVMRLHPVYGEELMLSIGEKNFPSKKHYELILELVKNHHERYNGKGYPCGIKGGEIPVIAQLGAVADVFDALVSRRSYKNKVSINKASEIIIAEEKEHFSPLAIECYKKSLPLLASIYSKKLTFDPKA